MTVRFFEARQTFGDAMKRRLMDAFDTERFVDGSAVADLEREIARYTSARAAIAVGSGTDALAIVMAAAGVGPGDEVIVPVYTFIATAAAVVHLGAIPKFVDIEPETFTLSVDRVAEAIGPRTRAVVPVHLFAHMADLARLSEVAKDHPILIIEDSAEALGMRWSGVHAGLVGNAGVLSFFPTKTLAGFGDGGMIITNDLALARRCRAISRLGWADDDESLAAWPPSLMDEVQAMIVLDRLCAIDCSIRRRRELADLYDEALTGLAPFVSIPSRSVEPADTVVYAYVITADRRDALAGYLASRGIETETYYPRPLHLQPCFGTLGYTRGDFPVAEWASEHSLALPMYPAMQPADISIVVSEIRRFYAASS
jgi:dTDP-4-amino-4,6-dideoxygalactose transaminase